MCSPKELLYFHLFEAGQPEEPGQDQQTQRRGPKPGNPSSQDHVKPWSIGFRSAGSPSSLGPGKATAHKQKEEAQPEPPPRRKGHQRLPRDRSSSLNHSHTQSCSTPLPLQQLRQDMWTKNQMNGVAQGLGILDSHVRSHAIEGHCPHSQPRGQPVISNAPPSCAGPKLQ